MADTSPRDARNQPGRHGMPGRMAVRPPETSGALLLDTDVAERRCWRCLASARSRAMKAMKWNAMARSSAS